mmetsp:Transcript_31867/g.36386  ORF Transcript_31867/g.36386 Transcript_31867/m.36386 type:complete len:86 (+) Transcript_31867:158-415(+)
MLDDCISPKFEEEIPLEGPKNHVRSNALGQNKLVLDKGRVREEDWEEFNYKPVYCQINQLDLANNLVDHVIEERKSPKVIQTEAN